jgi:glycosyltransferase involved in cell wall biosynthesis
MILMYHKVHPDSPSIWWVYVNDFYRQMSEITNKEVVYLEDYDVDNPNHVVITFDGIYKNVLDYALPILNHFNYPFELFITSDYIGLENEFDTIEPNASFTNEYELLELVKGGGRLQWHTQSHINLKNVHDFDVIVKELTIPENIKKLDRNGFSWFAYPYGEFNEAVVREVKNRFKGAVSCFQGDDNDIYRLNRLTALNGTTFRENKIACIIASYNYGNYLIEAIESVLRQTIMPNEILISDDCSDDETQIIAENYVKKHPNLISYNRNKNNMGIVKHFNKAISLIKAEYVFFLGADNRLVSNYVEECSKILDSNSEIAIAYTDYALFGSRAKLIYQTFADERKSGVLENIFYQIRFPEFVNSEDSVVAMQSGNFIHGSSMYRVKAFQDVGGYVETTSEEDYNLFKRMLEKGWKGKKVASTNLEYRQHTLGQANNVLSIQNRMLFYKRAYLNKDVFEKSKIYKIAYRIYRMKNFLFKNYKNPFLIFSKIKKYL